MMHLRSRYTKAFTLIELLVVISIISLLASIVLASLNSARAKARDARRESDIHNLQIAIQLYYDTNGEYPPITPDAGVCPACWDNSTNGFMGNLVPNYLSQQILDPENINYYYNYQLGNASSLCPANTKAVLNWRFETKIVNSGNYILCSLPNVECLCFD